MSTIKSTGRENAAASVGAQLPHGAEGDSRPAVAPRCIYCGTRAVRRTFGVSNPGVMGPRIMHGVRWRWFCGTSCSARHRMEGAPRERMQRVTEANMRAAQQRLLQRLITATKHVIREDGLVDPKDMVRVLMQELRGQYQRVYHRRRASMRGTEQAA